MYETELTREILKSPMAQKMIGQITPRYGEAYAFLHLMQCIGIEWDEMLEWAESFRLQVVPQTATWAIDWWEEQYNIISDPSWSLERRRQNVVAKMISRGPMNPARMAKIVSAATGFDARIEENTGKNRFAIIISASEDMVDEEAVRRVVDVAKPARLNYDVKYEQSVTGGIYFGGIIRQAREITLRTT